MNGVLNSMALLGTETDSSELEMFEYLQTRLRMRATNLIGERDYARLLEMSPDQIAHQLSELGYGEQARSLGLTQSGTDLIRGMVERHLAAEMDSLRRLCTPSIAASAWLRAYAWKYDLMQVRFVVRSRRARMVPNSPVVMSALANLKPEVYQRMFEPGAINLDAAEFAPIAASPFAETLRRHLRSDTGDYEAVEAALLSDYHQGVIRKFLASAPRYDPVHRILSADLDYTNLVTVLSARDEKRRTEDILPRLIPHGFWAHGETARGILGADSLAEMAKNIERAAEGGFFSFLGTRRDALTTPAAIERAARRALLHLVRHCMRSPFESPGAVIGYVIMQEIEGRNLSALAAAKQAGFTALETAPYLVTEAELHTA